jgi:uncharacterized membrane protein YkoI
MKRYTVGIVAAAALLVGCNQSVQTASEKFNELPAAVQKTVRAQAPNKEIVDVSKTTENGSPAYEVQFQGQGTNPKMLVAQDGTLLSSDFTKTPGVIQKFLTPTGATGTPFSALPVAVQKTIQEQAPHGQITDISRQEDNGQMVYKVTVANQGTTSTFKVAQDGKLLASPAQ